MAVRNTVWTAGGVAAAVLLAGGFWGGKALSTSAATPRVAHGTVKLVSEGGEALLFRLTGTRKVTSYSLPSDLEWRDAYGTWNDGTRPACLRPGRSGQHITLGIVSVEPVGDAPGGDTITWVECARRPVPHFRIVDPHSTRP
jgi:hypothetical protein